MSNDSDLRAYKLSTINQLTPDQQAMRDRVKHSRENLNYTRNVFENFKKLKSLAVMPVDIEVEAQKVIGSYLNDQLEISLAKYHMAMKAWDKLCLIFPAAISARDYKIDQKNLVRSY